MKSQSFRSLRRHGFTMVELMVSIAVMILLLLMVFGMVDQTQKTWSRASAQANQFREARMGFEAISRRVRQAVLNTYFDYEYANKKPKKYIRQSELHFVCGPTSQSARKPEAFFPAHSVFFQGPFGYSDDKNYDGFTDMMNAWGYYVEFSDDRDQLPEFLQSAIQPKFRYRLKEFRLPAESLKIYQDAEQRRLARSSNDTNWFTPFLSGGEKTENMRRVVSENIVALVITPMKSAPGRGTKATELFYETGYAYDSRNGLGATGAASATSPQSNLHLLPSLLRITMVAVDEKTAQKYDKGAAPPQFVPGSLFRNPQNLEADLRQLAQYFQSQTPKIDYRIFNSMVSLREANWMERDTGATKS